MLLAFPDRLLQQFPGLVFEAMALIQFQENQLQLVQQIIQDMLGRAYRCEENFVLFLFCLFDFIGTIIGEQAKSEDQRDYEYAHPYFIEIRWDDFEGFL